MKISKTECDKDFSEKKLELSDEKCVICEYYHCCPFIFRSYEDVIHGE